MKTIMDRIGCLVVVFGGLFAAFALMPIAILVGRSDNLLLIAGVAYAEILLLNIAGGIILATRESDLWLGLGNALGVAAVIFIAVFFSFNYAAQGEYDLRRNSFYTHAVGIPLSLLSCWASFYITYRIRLRKRSRSIT